MTRGVSPSINAAMRQGDMSWMEMVTRYMVYGAGVGTNDMDRKRRQLRSQHWVTKTILTVISSGARSVSISRTVYI